MRWRIIVRIASFFAVACALWHFMIAPDRSSIAEAATTISPDGYQLTFDENFDRLDVSPWGPGTRWIAHTPWNGDFGDAQFTDPGPDFPFRVQDGILHIEARKDDQGKWRSGLLASVDAKRIGFQQKFGYFEIRARFPKGKGVWPAFWLSSNGPEKSVEIDVVEYYGQFPDHYNATLHIWDMKNSKASQAYSQTMTVPSGSLSSDFHTYGVAVDADLTRFFLDRRQVWAIATPRELQQQPLAILLNLALGSGWPIDETPNPSIMDVDYVRVWALPTK